MSARRFITTTSGQWGLSELARRHHLAPGTLSKRLNRLGYTATGLQRALATGIMTHSQAGQIGASRSPWRYQI